MARPKRVSMTSAQKKEQRRVRREARKASSPIVDVVTSSRSPVERTAHEEAQFWVMTRDRSSAYKILNDHRERPWWLSIPGTGSSPPVISNFFPCSMFRRGSRWYYGFLFRQHRDAMFNKQPNARKELTQ